jgi:type IV pilus assembly protein PilQ
VVRGATLPASLTKTLDASRFGGPVRTVSSYTDRASGLVRIVVELSRDVVPRLDTRAGSVALRFAAAPAVTTRVPSPVVGGFGATSSPVTQTSVAQLNPKRKVYRGPSIDLDYKDADIHDLLRALARVGNVNIVVPDEIRASVTVQLKRVAWDQALEVILAAKGLWFRKEGNLYRIGDRKTLDAEDEAEAARLRSLVDRESPRPEVFTLNYANAADLATKLAALKSPKGKIEVDDRTNSLIINDVAANRREIIDLAARLDRQTPQISIEARIVEARSGFKREFGIQWGGRAGASAASGNATGLIFPSAIGFTGGADDATKPSTGLATPSDFAVNLPTTASNGALGMTLGSVGGAVNINLRLSALEDSGTARIISSPKVTVLNNVAATMKQGIRIPISQVSANGTQTVFVEANLELKVKPNVSQRDCAVVMDISVVKAEPDFSRLGARGDPTIQNREATTTMLVADGETSVMGGIYTRSTSLNYSQVPVLGDIPVLGWLFKSRKEADDRAELLIFITPKITNRALLGCTP